MNKLPQEVFDLIAENLDWASLPVLLAHYATLSRQWRYAVEQRLFRKLTVSARDMQTLESMLLDNRRQGYLRVLGYRIGPISSTDKGDFVASEPHSRLIKELERLWKFLSRHWSHPLSERGPRLLLALGIFVDPEQHTDAYHNARPCLGSTYLQELWTPARLPGVQKLSVGWGLLQARSSGVQPAQNYQPSWLFKILPACPSLARLFWNVFEPYTPVNTVGANLRAQLASNLAVVRTLGHLQHLHLNFQTPDLNRHGNDVEDCRQPVADTLNRVLHRLSRQLRTLGLTGRFLLSPELFWPKLDSSGDTISPGQPLWPHLRVLKTEARLPSPEGLFYFHPQIGRAWGANTAEMLGRSDATAVSDLVTRASRAMLQMPMLEWLSVAFPEVPYPVNRALKDHVILYSKEVVSHIIHGHWDDFCTLPHRPLPAPWWWCWQTPCPSEAESNWRKLVGRLRGMEEVRRSIGGSQSG